MTSTLPNGSRRPAGVRGGDTADDATMSVVPPEVLSIRWEQNPWSVETVDAGRDRQRCRELQPFARQALLTALTELEVGEVCVTETLSPLADHAPTMDDRLYLCTQLADEARHVRFFRQYFAKALEVDLNDPTDGLAMEADAEYRKHFDGELRRMTAAVRANGDRRAWYGAVVYYHLMTEGVLAFTVLQSARRLARRLQLEALSEGLAHVTRDEARHVTFGVGAALEGVKNGYRHDIRDLFLGATALVARVLVGPGRRVQAPKLAVALEHRVQQLEEQWKAGRARLMRELSLIGLEAWQPEVAAAWSEACSDAIDDYERQWGEPHPVRRLRQSPEGRREELFVG